MKKLTFIAIVAWASLMASLGFAQGTPEFFYCDYFGRPCINLNSNTVNFGQISNINSTTWGLGHGTSKTSRSKTALTWDVGGNVVVTAGFTASSITATSFSVGSLSVTGGSGSSITYGLVAGSVTTNLAYLGPYLNRSTFTNGGMFTAGNVSVTGIFYSSSTGDSYLAGGLGIGAANSGGNKLYVNGPFRSGAQTIVGAVSGSTVATTAAADGTAYYLFTSSADVSPAAAAEVASLRGEYNWNVGDNANFVASGVEGVCRARGADESMTCRGVYGRFYIDPSLSGTLRTGIGGEFSARASYSGGTEIAAEAGTAFVGTRIWMAPYFTAASTGNITNFHGLWLYNEHATQAVENGIKIGSAGGGFEKDINLQNGETIDNKTDGVIAMSGSLAANAGAYFGGSVGVGTTNPTSALTVAGTGSFAHLYATGTVYGAKVNVGNTGSSAYISAQNPVYAAGAYFDGIMQSFGSDPLAFTSEAPLNPSLNRWGFKLRETAEGDLTIYSYSNSKSRLRIDNSGNIYWADGVNRSTATNTGGLALAGPLSATTARLTKTMISPEGGNLVMLITETAMSSGTVVTSTGATVDYGVTVASATNDTPLGFVYGSTSTTTMGSCAAGNSCWICTTGICGAIYSGASCPRGSWAGTTMTGPNGTIECISEPPSPPGHDREVGHAVTAGADAMVWLMTHFR